MQITLTLTEFYSEGDERRFFQALSEIPAITDLRGQKTDLIFYLQLNTLSNLMLRELIALCWRYDIPLKALQPLHGIQKFAWLNNPIAYWYPNMFLDDLELTTKK